MSDYVAEWLSASDVIGATLGKLDPTFEKEMGYFAPSFAGTDVGSGSNSMAPLAAFQHGLNAKRNIKQLSGHKYELSPSISHDKTLTQTSATWEVPQELE